MQADFYGQLRNIFSDTIKKILLNSQSILSPHFYAQKIYCTMAFRDPQIEIKSNK